MRERAFRRLFDSISRLLIRAYPRSFRVRFEREFLEVKRRELERARRKGRIATLAFWIGSSSDTLFSGLRERASATQSPRNPVGPNHLGLGRGKRRMTMSLSANELRQALRRLLRSPGFSLTAIVTLGLGIGAATAIFSVLQAVVLKPLPYPEPERLALISHSIPTGKQMGVPDGGYFYYSRQARTLSDLAIYLESSVPLTGLGEPLEVGVIQTTPSLFPVLGVAPFMGRAFSEEDAVPGADPVMIVSHGFWLSRYGGDPDIIGKIAFPGGRQIIVGVLGPDFDFIRPEASVTFGNPFDSPQVLVPLRLRETKARFGNFMYQGIARLAPGATAEEATRELNALIPKAALEYPGGLNIQSLEEGGHLAVVQPLKQAVIGNVRIVLWILMGAVGFVLLIATANVANLFLVRAESRRREIGIRRALGASRPALMRWFAAEGLLLGLLGGAVGVSLAAAGTRILILLAPANVPRLELAGIDLAVLAFAAVVSILAGALLGLLPLLRHWRVDLSRSIAERGRMGAEGRTQKRAQRVLVVTQVALALILLVGSGLLLRTFQSLRAVDPGFGGSNVLTLRLSLPSGKTYGSDVNRTRFLLGLTEKLEGIAGVERAAFSSDLPLDGNEWTDAVAAEDAIPEKGSLGHYALRSFVGPGYLETIGARLVQGRELERPDFADYPRVAVVNESFARQRWPGKEAVGRRIAQWYGDQDPNADVWYTVVGVVSDVRERSLMRGPEPTAYLPSIFLPKSGFAMFVRNMIVVVRTSGAPLAVMPEIRNQIHALDPEIPIDAVRSLESLKAASTQQVSFALILLIVAALVAVVLGIVGVYGVVSYVVGRRTQEFGVRIALGATSGALSRKVLGEESLVALAGVAVGIAGAMASSRLLESLLFGVSSLDAGVYALASTGLFGLVVLASLLPAQRAARVDPTEAIRGE